MPQSTPSLLTISQAAKFLGVSADTLRNWDDSGKLRSIRTEGNQRRYYLSEISAFKNTPLKYQRQIVTPDPAVSSAKYVSSLLEKEAPTTHNAFPQVSSARIPMNLPAAPATPIPAEYNPTDISSTYVPPELRRPLIEFSLIQGKLLAGFILTFVAFVAILGLDRLGVLQRIPFFTNTSLIKSTDLLTYAGAIDSTVLAATANKDMTLTFDLPIHFKRFVTFDENFFGNGSATISGSLTIGSGAVITGPTTLENNLQVNEDAVVTGTLTVGGQIIAPNIITGLTAGTGISVTTGQTPTITNTDLGSAQKFFAKFKVSSQDDVTAGANADTITLAAGSGISLTTSSSDKKITITSSASSSTNDNSVAAGGTGLTTYAVGDMIYASAATTLARLAIGSSNQILAVSGSGLPSWVSASSLITCTDCVVTSPSATQTITPTSATAIGLSIAQPVAGSVDIFNVTNNGGGTKFLSVDSSGYVLVGTYVASDLTPYTGSAFDLGTSARRWRNVYADNGNFTNLTSATLTVSGTTAEDFLINTDYTGPDSQSSTLSFERGAPGVNAQLMWRALEQSAPNQLFTLNAPLFINQDTGINYSGTAALIVNQVQSQDIFAASASGVTRFVINNAGDVTSGTYNSQTISNAASFTGSLTVANNFVVSAGTLTTPLSSGAVYSASGVLTSEAQLAIARGGTNGSAVPTAGTIAYGTGTAYAFTTAGSSGQLLMSNGAGTPSWIVPTVLGTNYWQNTANVLAPGGLSTVTDRLVLGGNTATSHQFEVNGKVTGFSLVNLNETGDQNILTASASGTNVFTLDRSGNITAGSLINGQTISAAASFTGSLTVASGFTVTAGVTRLGNLVTDGAVFTSGGNGTLNSETNLAIARGGTNGSATPTAGALAYGTGTAYGFTTVGTGGQILISQGTSAPIWVDPGVGGINYWTLTSNSLSPYTPANNLSLGGSTTTPHFLGVSGAVTGQALVGLNETGDQNILTASASGVTQFTIARNGNLTTAGTITSTSLASGALYSATGVISSEAQLAIARGGTNSTATPTQGGISYGTGTAYAFSTAGTSGQLFMSNGTAAPTWTPAASVGTNYWQLASNVLAPGGLATVTDRLVLGGQTSTPHQFEVNGAVTGFSLVSLNETGDQNIFTASASGVTKFTISHAGNVGIGTSDADKLLHLYQGTANTGSEIQIDTAGTQTSQQSQIMLVTKNDGTSGLGLSVNKGWTFFGRGDAWGTAGLQNDFGLAYWNGTDWFADIFNIDSITQNVGIGTSVPASKLQVTGATTGKALFALNETGDQNILTASASGSTVFSISRTGSLVFNPSGSANATTLTATTPTGANAITLPDASGEISVLGQTIEGTEIADSTIAEVDLSATNGPTPGFILSYDSGGGFTWISNTGGTGASKWTDAGAFTYLTDVANSLAVGGSTADTAAFYLDITSGNISLEGSAADGFETTLTLTNPTADNTITIPDASGEISLLGQTIEGTEIADSTIAEVDLSLTNTAVAGYVLSYDSGGGFTWITNDGGTGASKWQLNGSTLAPLLSTQNLSVGGLTAATSILQVSGAATGKALAVFNETGDQDILTASASGVTQFTIARNGNLTTAGTITSTPLASGALYSSSGTLTSEAQLAIARGGTNSTATPTQGGISYGTGTAYAFTSAGTSGQLFMSNGTASPTWIAPSSVGTNFWQLASNVLAPGGSAAVTDRLVLGGLTSTVHQLEINGQITGKSLVNLNETGDQNILTASASGTTVFVLDRSGNVTAGTYNGQTLSATANLTGSLTVASGLTVTTGTTRLGGLTTDGVVYTSGGNGTLNSETLLAIARGGTNSSATPTQGGISYGTGTAYAFTSAGTSGQVFMSNGTASPSWISAASLGTNYWQNNTNVLAPGGFSTVTDRLVLGGQTTTAHQFEVNGKITGLSLVNLNETGDQNILTASASGVTQFTIARNGNITAAGTITSTPLASGALYSNSGTLTSEAQLAIARGGTNGTATPTQGGLSYGTGTAYAFTAAGTSGQLLQSNGTSTPTWVAASSVGTNYWQLASNVLAPGGLAAVTDRLVLGGQTSTTHQLEVNGKITGKSLVNLNETGDQNILTASASGTTVFILDRSGNITAGTYNGQTISATANLTGSLTVANTFTVTTGTTRLGGLTTDGVVYTSGGNGTLNSETLLAIARGGTNSSATPTQGGISYGTGTAYAFTSAGTSGQVFMSNGTASPSWISAASLGTNYWQNNTNVLAPGGFSTVTDRLVLGGQTATNHQFEVNGKVTGFSLVNLNETGNQNILTASASGTTVFVLDRSGNVTAGTYNGQTLSATANLTGSLTVASGLTVTTGTTRLGGLTTDGVVYTSGGNGTLNSETLLAIARGGTNSSATPTQGGISYGTGTAYAFTSAGTSGQVFMSNGTASPSWISAASLGTNYWQNNTNVLAPGGFSTVTDRLVLGGGTTTVHQLEVNGQITGKSLVNLNETGDQNILTASASGVTRFVITHAGDVGIGTINPASELEIASEKVTDTRGLTLTQAGTTFAAKMRFQKSEGTLANPTTVASGDYVGAFGFAPYTASGYIQTAGFGSYVNGSVSAGVAPTDIYFYTGSTDNTTPILGGTRLYITSAGHVGIGDSITPPSKLSVEGVTIGKALVNLNETGDQNILTASASGTTVFILDRSGNITAGTYNGLTVSGSGGTLTVPTGSSLIRAGAHALTLTTTNATNATFPEGTITLADLGTIQTFTAEKTFNALTIADSSVTLNQSTTLATNTGTADTLTINNAGAGTLTLNLTDGSLQTGGSDRLTNAGALANITGYTQTSGNFGISGAGTFGTGTGAISLNGNTTIAANSSLFLAVGTGKAGIGVITPDSKLQVDGAVTGKALVSFNETGDQDILTASASGVTRFALSHAGVLTLNALASGAVYSASGVITSESQLAIARGGTNSTATPTAGALAYGTGTAYAFTSAGTTGQILMSSATGSPVWVDPGTLPSSNYFQLNSDDIAPLTTTNSLVLGGPTATTHRFEVNGAATGKSLMNLNETGDQDILSASASGVNVFRLDRTGKIYATAGDITNSTFTSGNLFNLSTGTANTWNTGYLLNVTSSSTALTTGRLAYLNWDPGTTTTAATDLFRLNIGQNGNVTNILNITDNGSTVFSVSETAITSALPHAFTAVGDVSISYDLEFTNQTASYIKSNAPFYIQAGENFESNNLTLQTYNSGSIIMDLASGGVGIGSNITPSGKLEVNGAKTGKALVILNETGNQNILTASASGVTMFNLSRTGSITLPAQTTVSSITSTQTNTDVLDLTANSLTSGNIMSLANSGASQATNNFLNIAQTGVTTGFTGSLINLSSTSTTGAANLINLTANAATAGNLINLTGNALTTGSAVKISSSSTGALTGLLSITASAAHTGSAVNISTATQTGNGLSLAANSLTTGNAVSISSTSTAGGAAGNSYLVNLARSGTNSNASHTAYGLLASVTDTGTTSTNIAGAFTATGATTNYSLSLTGDILVNAQPDATGSMTIINTSSTAGTFDGDSTVNGAFSSAVYNGKVYIASNETDLSNIYRYDGSNTWTKVNDSSGKIIAADTANIDASVLTVYNNKLYAGTQTGANTGALYEYNGSTWTLINATRGTFATATSTDGVSDLAVYNSALWIGLQESTAGGSIVYWTGSNTFTLENSLGAPCNGDATDADSVLLKVYNGFLYTGVASGASGTARLCFYNDTDFIMVQATRGTFEGQTGINDITAMEVYNGALYIGLGETDLASVYAIRWAAPYSPNTDPTFIKTNTTSGRLDATNDATDIDSVTALRVYNGRLYAGTNTANLAAIYELTGFTPSSTNQWTLVNGARGTFSSQTSVDKVTSLIPFNGALYIGTEESNAGSVYTWTKTLSNSYALKFDSGSSNLASVSFVGQNQGISNTNNTGAFNFSHAVSLTSNSFDIAEDYPTRDDLLQPGDIVAIDTSESEFVKRASNTQNVIGIYSAKPGLRLSGNDESLNGGRMIPIALAGRVPVKVSDEAGPIMAGDLLTLSSIPGVAMKATRPGRIIGQALGDYTGTGVGTVTVFINNSWADPGNFLAFDAQGNLDLDHPIVSAATDTTDATASATLTDDVSETPEPLSLTNLNSQFLDLTSQVASLSAQLANLQVTTPPTLVTDELNSDIWLLSSDSTGRDLVSTIHPLQVPQLTVAGKLSVGLITIDDLEASLSSLTGKITINGDLGVSGVLTAPLVSAQVVETEHLQVLGTKTLGTGLLPAGVTEVFVEAPAISSQSAVFVTPQGLTAFPLSVTESVPEAYFKIETAGPQDTDIPFRWWIVN